MTEGRVQQCCRAHRHGGLAQGCDGLTADGLAADTAIMIGDRAVDIHAGKSNALAAAGVLWGFGERAELEAACPDFLFGTPGDLAELLLQ